MSDANKKIETPYGRIKDDISSGYHQSEIPFRVSSSDLPIGSWARVGAKWREDQDKNNEKSDASLGYGILILLLLGYFCIQSLFPKAAPTYQWDTPSIAPIKVHKQTYHKHHKHHKHHQQYKVIHKTVPVEPSQNMSTYINGM